MTQYRWAAGFRSKRVDPQAAGEFIEGLPDRTPAAVVAAAKKKRSPIHRLFEWNDATAAKEYRLEQARLTVRSVVVVFRDDQDEERTTRAFVHIKRDDSAAYETIADVMSDATMKRQLMERGLKEMDDFRRRYADVEAFAEVFDAIDRAAA